MLFSRIVGSRSLLDIEDGVDWVHSSLVLSGLTDQTLLSSEGDERRGGEATLLVGDWKKDKSEYGQKSIRMLRHTDFDIGALVVGNARVGGT